MWVIGPTLSADKCFAYAEFKQTPVVGPAGRWSPSVYPTDDEFLSGDRGGKILETDESDEGFHTLKWKTYSHIFQWVDSESLELTSEGKDGIVSGFDSRIEKENQLRVRMAPFFDPNIFDPKREIKVDKFDMWNDVIMDALTTKEKKETVVSKEQFLTARNNFYDIERQLLQSEIKERIFDELQGWLATKSNSLTDAGKAGIDISETQMSKNIEQCELFIDDHIGNIQRHIAVDELKMAPFASRMSNPELSYAFSLWRDVKHQRLNKAAVVFSVPRTPW